MLTPEPQVLHLAAWWGHVELIRALVALGGNVTGLDDSGFTPLHYASMTGRERERERESKRERERERERASERE